MNKYMHVYSSDDSFFLKELFTSSDWSKMTLANYIGGLFLAGTGTGNSKIASRNVPSAREFLRERKRAILKARPVLCRTHGIFGANGSMP